MSGVLFCPFCGESFEREERCPDHDLDLVSFERLPPGARSEGNAVEEDGPEESGGAAARGLVGVGAALVAIGFALPFVSYAVGERETHPSAFVFAIEEAPTLWGPLLAAAALMTMLSLRVDRRHGSVARMGAPLLALSGAASLAYTAWRVVEAAHAASWMGEAAEVALQSGAWVMVAGLALAGIAGLRLG